jgi:hypothetical protein
MLASSVPLHLDGVLHHIPYAEAILRRGGAEIATEIRLMLYSDRGWLKYSVAPLPPWLLMCVHSLDSSASPGPSTGLATMPTGTTRRNWQRVSAPVSA